MSLGIELFEHTPTSLIPLLKSHLPASIFVYGALVSPAPPAPFNHPSTRIWSTTPPQSDGGEVQISAEGVIIVAPTPIAGSGQIRIFDTSESLWATPSPSKPEIEVGRQRVVAALSTYVSEIDPDLKLVGALHEFWVKAVENNLGDGVSRPGCGTWFGPESSCERRDRSVEGYEVDIGRDADIEDVSITPCTIY